MKLEYHSEDSLSRYYGSSKTGMFLHSSCVQMLLLCDVSLLPVSFEPLQLFLINKQELPLRCAEILALIRLKHLEYLHSCQQKAERDGITTGRFHKLRVTSVLIR